MVRNGAIAASISSLERGWDQNLTPPSAGGGRLAWNSSRRALAAASASNDSPDSAARDWSPSAVEVDVVLDALSGVTTGFLALEVLMWASFVAPVEGLGFSLGSAMVAHQPRTGRLGSQISKEVSKLWSHRQSVAGITNPKKDNQICGPNVALEIFRYSGRGTTNSKLRTRFVLPPCTTGRSHRRVDESRDSKLTRSHCRAYLAPLAFSEASHPRQQQQQQHRCIWWKPPTAHIRLTHTHQRMASVEKTRRGLRASLVKGDVPRYLRAVETVRHEVNGGQQDSEEGRKRFHFVEWHSGCANELWKQKSHAQVCVYLNLGKVSSTGVVFCGGSCRKKSVCAASGSSPWWIGKLQSLLVLGSGDVRCLAHGGGQQARTTRKHLEVPLLLSCFSCGS